MEDDELLAKYPPDDQQRFDQHSQVGKVLDALTGMSGETEASHHSRRPRKRNCDSVSSSCARSNPARRSQLKHIRRGFVSRFALILGRMVLSRPPLVVAFELSEKRKAIVADALAGPSAVVYLTSSMRQPAPKRCAMLARS